MPPPPRHSSPSRPPPPWLSRGQLPRRHVQRVAEAVRAPRSRMTMDDSAIVTRSRLFTLKNDPRLVPRTLALRDYTYTKNDLRVRALNVCDKVDFADLLALSVLVISAGRDCETAASERLGGAHFKRIALGLKPSGNPLRQWFRVIGRHSPSCVEQGLPSCP